MPPSLPPKWAEIEALPRYQALDDEAKARQQDRWLMDVHKAGRAGELENYQPQQLQDLAKRLGFIEEGKVGRNVLPSIFEKETYAKPWRETGRHVLPSMFEEGTYDELKKGIFRNSSPN